MLVGELPSCGPEDGSWMRSLLPEWSCCPDRTACPWTPQAPQEPSLIPLRQSGWFPAATRSFQLALGYREELPLSPVPAPSVPRGRQRDRFHGVFQKNWMHI